MSRMLPLLPVEIFEEILCFALDVHPARHAIPRVNSTWAEISLPLLHSRIRITSPLQLHLFSAAQSVLQCASGGREVEVRLSGGTDGAGVWAMIYQALARCQRHAASTIKSCCRGVTVLRLCMNSHLNDTSIHLVHEALSQVNPEVFVWKGPDPEHHFSTAIVSSAASQLCRAMCGWSSLKHLELANVSFLDGGFELAHALRNICQSPSFPFDPPYSDKIGPGRIVISQTVFMFPATVLRIALGVPALQEFCLVDVYQHSIWGSRMRMGDVEALLANSVYTSRAPEQECLERVRQVVRCVVKNERLMGGDRAV